MSWRSCAKIDAMRVLAHLSDLHFGRVDEALVGPLQAVLAQLRPHLVVVTGDLTQRARSAQFRSARAFLDALPARHLVVPGNHDVPLYDIGRRFLRPLARYRRYIGDVEPLYVDEEVAVAGVNTARSLTVKGGRINAEQLARIRERFGTLPPHTVRVVATHHPFDVPRGQDVRQIVGRAAMAMEALSRCGVDICLAGHAHVAHVSQAASRYAVAGHGALLVQAGTATSTRARGEANSFNVLHIERPEIRVEHHAWSPERRAFQCIASVRFRQTADGWYPA